MTHSNLTLHDKRRAAILLIDDDELYCSMMAYKFRAAGHRFCYETKISGVEACLDTFRPDLVFVDYHLNDQFDGATLCQWLRARTTVPIVAISADDNREIALTNLDAGAIGFVPKSDDAELMIRMSESLARYRFQAKQAFEIVQTADGRIALHLTMGSLSMDSQVHQLSELETRIVNILMAEFSQVVPKTRIFERIYGFEFDSSSRALDIAISRLRRRVFRASAFGIFTHRNRGYRLDYSPQKESDLMRNYAPKNRHDYLDRGDL